MTKESIVIDKTKAVRELYAYVNNWADERKHDEAHEPPPYQSYITDYGKGYEQACRDIFQKMRNLGL